MIIKTKFNLDDDVWIIHKDKVINVNVNEIIISIKNSTQNVIYYLRNGKDEILENHYIVKKYNENDMFATKEELFKSI